MLMANIADIEGKIPRKTFGIVIGILFGTAIIAASLRTAVRLHLQRKLYLEDAFLILAGLALIAGTTVLFESLTTVFIAPGFAEEGLAYVVQAGINPAAEIHSYQVYRFVHEPLCWIVIFSVKASFLGFFHKLISRIQKLLLYWRVVCAITLGAFFFCACNKFISCPYTDSEAVECAQGSGQSKSSAITGTAIGLDVATDIMIISIPASVLWQVRMHARQKLGIGIFLSLSIFVVIVACIRIMGIHFTGKYGYTWQFFWLEVEACVAVTMISILGFRSFFVPQKPKINDKKGRPWVLSTVAKLRKRRKTSASHDMEGLPSISSGTLTGMRTFIRGSRLGSGPETYRELTGLQPLKLTGQAVLITQDVYWEEEVGIRLPASRSFLRLTATARSRSPQQ